MQRRETLNGLNSKDFEKNRIGLHLERYKIKNFIYPTPILFYTLYIHYLRSHTSLHSIYSDHFHAFHEKTEAQRSYVACTKITRQVNSGTQIGALGCLISSPFFSHNMSSEEGGPCPKKSRTRIGEVRGGALMLGRGARLMQEATETPRLRQGG